MTTQKKQGRPQQEPTKTITLRIKKSDFKFFDKLANRNQFVLDCVKQSAEYKAWLAKKQADDKTPALF